MRTFCSGPRGDHEHSDVSLCLREAFSVRRLRPFARSEMHCLPQGLLFCRPSDIPGCAMSDPSHLRRKSELPNERQPNIKHSQGEWSRRSDPRMQAQSRRQRPTHHNPNNMKPATIQPTYHTCAIDCRRSTEYQFDVLPNSSSRSILRLAFDESSARRILPKLHSD